ncbi:hypothetical protein BSKO_07959 [Bryopsis sp. KO-2023]|nr:hypothetical protein BSKO_07959 [Bryopsis sp. KO-2023]
MSADTKRQAKEFSLEEDDAFEEFEVEEWSKEYAKDEGDAPLWEPDWDDEDREADFATKLKEELKKMGKA